LLLVFSQYLPAGASRLTVPLLGLSAEASLHKARAAPWHRSHLVGFRAPDQHFALLDLRRSG